MKKILVAFDGSLYSESALNYAIKLTQKEPENLITGIFIEDLNYAYMFSNFGVDPAAYELTGEYGEYLDEIRNTEEESIQKSREAFLNQCQEAGVNHTTHFDEGVTALELIRESIFADLLIIGYQTYFSSTRKEGDQKVLKDILSDTKCPVLVVPENEEPIDNVIFTFNGKENSVYAIRHFTYLLKPNLQDVHYNLIYVNEKSSDEKMENEELIREYLYQHYPNLDIDILEGKPGTKIQEFASQKQNALLVLGSFEKNALSRLFASSVAKGFLEAKTTPVFIAHR